VLGLEQRRGAPRRAPGGLARRGRAVGLLELAGQLAHRHGQLAHGDHDGLGGLRAVAHVADRRARQTRVSRTGRSS
jgi:hypothetical protein